MQFTLKAYAKINLFLAVTGKREDGYHNLQTVMQSIDLYDMVSFSDDCDGLSVSCDVAELNGEKNLAYRAALAFFDAAELNPRAKIHIKKQIPVLAGLGGGSADAAVVLRGLEQLTGCVLDDKKRIALAASLGADVPFCLYGGTALAGGIGEVLNPIMISNSVPLILIKPCQKQSTGEMFRQLDEIGVLSDGEKCDILNRLGNDAARLLNAPYNDFMRLYKNTPVSEAEKCLSEAGAVGVGLTGSGPTVFGTFNDEQSAADAFEKLKNNYNECYLSHTVFKGWEKV